MGKHDWYRLTTWSEADQVAFFSRLNRSRSLLSKVQYLRIQAWYLFQVGTPEMIEASLALVEKLLRDHPVSFESGPAHTLRTQCLLALGRKDEAIEACRASLHAQRTSASARDDAYLLFGELVLRAKREELYDEVATALEEFGKVMILPVQRFRFACVRTFLAKYTGDHREAAQFARQALSEAGLTTSGLSQHPNLGLVQGVSPELRQQLEDVANAQ
jgi:tetratricopeptide (TPR) repeat protein